MGASSGGARSRWSQRWAVSASIATVAATLVALVALLNSLGVISPFGGDGATSVFSTGDQTSSAAPVPSSPLGAGSPVAPAGSSTACQRSYFDGVLADRIKSLEEGAFDVTLLRRGDPVGDPAGLTFSFSGRPLGALRFRFFPESELFVVESVVDDGCRIVADFFNETRPDFPKDRLQSNNTLNVRFGSSAYRVHFVHDSGGSSSSGSGAPDWTLAGRAAPPL